MTKQEVKREQTLSDMANKITKLDKENELLGERCNQLLKDKGALLDQIEKMKCCGNCENRYGQEKCADCHNYSKWKFKQAEQFYEEIVE